MGLFRTAARTAVASSVHGRVQQRQRSRWVEQERHAAAGQLQGVAAPSLPPAPTRTTEVSRAPTDAREQLELLAQLGELRQAGVLTEDEFATKKAAILKI